MVCVLLFENVFFFFQAEDGIRDRLVTGVQTCALPISCLKVIVRYLCRKREDALYLVFISKVTLALDY